MYHLIITLPTGNFFVLFCLLIFFKSTFSEKKKFRVSNSLDPDQAGRFVRPVLGPNCLQRISADGTKR